MARCRRDAHRRRRRIGARQPRTGRLGVVRRRRLLGQRRVGPRHQQHGRAHRRPRPAPADRGGRRPARLLRLDLHDQLDHQVDARLEAARLEEGRRQAGRQRRHHAGARPGDAGPTGALRVGEGAHRPRAERGGRRVGERRGARLQGRARARGGAGVRRGRPGAARLHRHRATRARPRPLLAGRGTCRHRRGARRTTGEGAADRRGARRPGGGRGSARPGVGGDRSLRSTLVARGDAGDDRPAVGPGAARGAVHRPDRPGRAPAGVAGAVDHRGRDPAQLALGALRRAMAAAVPPGTRPASTGAFQASLGLRPGRGRGPR